MVRKPRRREFLERTALEQLNRNRHPMTTKQLTGSIKSRYFIKDFRWNFNHLSHVLMVMHRQGILDRRINSDGKFEYSVAVLGEEE